ncbi:uncharacterized protein BO88DRAFT_447325 [Aspergillus vadensis CBS 113365]|uniref:Uncharacterized protein n=1 Tax=Aspergillus vadensis (strain CBS 113365 / IMI 142717 / IBT 24658) TaxID=1448311 RepID=A0A319BD71_ASPVC|nr:hypothetical protein BO88DRAFT_447325 [Aspergillus vadensis CBS 113365]PYH63963.1 hypothetical protein BO88DRAFT_447325 [Aspergillus vadensis CBS 113365]
MGSRHFYQAFCTTTLQLWSKFNICCLAVWQKQKNLTQALMMVIIPLPDPCLSISQIETFGEELIAICDRIEKHGLVDYEVRIWEEEILSSKTLSTQLRMLDQLAERDGQMNCRPEATVGESFIKQAPYPKMPQHLTTFRLSRNTRAAEQVISGLREHFETEAFRGLPQDEVYVESPLDSDALDRLKPILSLVCDGPVRVILSRVMGKTVLQARFPCLHFPVLIYESSLLDGKPLELGRGVYTDRDVSLTGRLVLITVVPTFVKVIFEPSESP